MNKKIHVILPTNNYNTMKQNFLNGIKCFEDFKDTVSFGLCFQNYTKEQIQEVINEFNKYQLDIRYVECEGANPEFAPMHQIRNSCCQLNNTCDYYFVVDDDLCYLDKNEFSKYFSSALDYLYTNPSCGVLSFMNTNKAEYPQKREYVFNIRVDLGCFIKNIYPNGNIVPEEYLDLVGGYQDVFFTYIRIMDGNLYAAYSTMKKAYHINHKPKSEISSIKYNWENIARKERGNFTILKQLKRQYSKTYKEATL